MKNRNIIQHSLAVVALIFFVGTACSDNSDEKAKLAQLQQQVSDQQIITQQQMSAQADNASRYKACMATAGTDTTAINACNNSSK